VGILAHNNIYIRSHKAQNPVADIWCIHGFGDSSLGFIEIFESELAQSHNIFAPDIPGFGSSPYSPSQDIYDAKDTLLELIDSISKDRKIVVIAHSLGGILGTWICKTLQEKVLAYVNIEGNLTMADTFFSGKAAKTKKPGDFVKYMFKKFADLLEENRAIQRYLLSLKLADPFALMKWGKSGVTATKKAGKEFKELKCKKIYVWGDKSIPKETLKFLKDNSISNKCFEGSGHCPMIDNALKFYEFLTDYIVEKQ